MLQQYGAQMCWCGKKELDESTRDVEELANLVRTKSEAIKTLQTKLAQAKQP